MKPIYFIIIIFIIFSHKYISAQDNDRDSWVRTYSTPAEDNNIPLDMTIDRKSNIYITGRGSGIGTGSIIPTVKYSPEGEKLLELLYETAGSFELGNSIIVDDDFNIYVSCRASVESARWKLMLLKYSDSGSLIWERTFLPDSIDSASETKIIQDNAQNIIVEGTVWVHGAEQLVLLNYNSKGDLTWHTYFGDDSTSHKFIDFDIDSNGNIYVAANRKMDLDEPWPETQSVLIKFDKYGKYMWSESFRSNNAIRIAIDSLSNINMIATHDIASPDNWSRLLQYNTDGELLWAIDYKDLMYQVIYLTDIITDSYDNIIVTGYTSGLDCFDIITIKYDNNGDLIWEEIYSSPDTLADYSHSMIVDKYDNIYITGRSVVSSQTSYCIAIKYNPDGMKEWASRFIDDNKTNNSGRFISVDEISNVFIAGKSGSKYLIIKNIQDIETSVELIDSELPNEYYLSQNYPNPFNPYTTIEFAIPTITHVELIIYDSIGREINKLVDKEMNAGAYKITFDGNKISSGVYYYVLKTSNYMEAKTFILLK